MKIVLSKRKFNTGLFYWDGESVDAEIEFSIYFMKFNFWFNVSTGDFSTNERNPIKAFMIVLEHSQVAAIKYLRLKEHTRG